ncbi:EAL domain-containing protein [Pseudoalteromonas sp. PS5]|uniref:EAL domain-containing protein n=1 Tax=Pseudoalteromonas sp. PS5 TaxID=1437473 RepID=UPI000FFF3250|nr:EAL domain-containing protein [Pseudoalteromonas sp. PS5]RXE97265.1 bifunctional diguanylate cyclase/phosphodiesterase [Pseudoalteromonas sp. PS5]
MRNKAFIGVQALLLCAPIALFAYFYSQQEINSHVHQARVSLLIEAKSIDAKLDAAVLQMLSAQLNQYDELAQLAHAIDELNTTQKHELFNHTDPDVLRQYEAYRALLSEKVLQVESIKTAAASIKNSLLYLPELVKELEQSDPELATKANRALANLMLGQLYEFAIEPIPHIPSESDVAKLIYQHFNVAVTRSVELKQARQRFLNLPSSDTFTALYSSYNRYHSQTLEKAKQQNELLLTLAIVLFLLLIVFANRLYAAKNKILSTSRTLSDAVARLTEGFALFSRSGNLLLCNSAWCEHFAVEDQSSMPRKLEQWQHQFGDIFNTDSNLHQTALGTWLQIKQTKTHNNGQVFVSVNVSPFKQAEEELRKWGHAIEQSPASIIITDPRARIEYVNPKFEQVTGYSLAEIKGQTPKVLGSKQGFTDYKALWRTIKQGKVWRGEFFNRRKSGDYYWEYASISPIKNQQGEIINFIAIKEDITAQKSASAQLKTAAAVFNATQEGIMTTNAKLEITAVNPAFTKITGYEEHEVLGQRPNILSSGKHDRHFYDQMWSTLNTQGQWASEIWNKRKDGTLYPEWLAISVVYDDKGLVQQYVAILSDMTERKAQEEQIEYQAYYDVLTGLPNRTLLLERIEQDIKRMSRTKHQSAVLFIDLDRFKRVNDTMGHEAGDVLLISVAKRLNELLRKSDTLSRFGGDEFVLLLSQITHPDHAAQVADKIVKALSEPFVINGFEVFTGASIGIAILPGDAKDQKELLRLADLAMYKAKEAGRNQYHFFAQEMQQQVNRRVELEQHLRVALEHKKITVHYQPIIDIVTGQLYGVEALMRWPTDFGQYISPAEFIPVAEESGLIAPLGEWLLGQACGDIRRLNKAIGLNCYLTVNVSSQQYRLGFNATIIKQIMQQSGFHPENLTLEITESILLEDDKAVTEWLQSLRATGVNLAIDDFGTGYSSLSYLKRFPINTLKIDRGFIQDIDQNQDAAVLVNAILSMAKSLSLKVIAEGVEQQGQLDSLKNLGCQYVQGYLYAKPMAIEGLIEWVERFTLISERTCHKLWLD